jgi:hypothetical protein
MNADVHERKPRAGWHLRFDPAKAVHFPVAPIAKGVAGKFKQKEKRLTTYEKNERRIVQVMSPHDKRALQ